MLTRIDHVMICMPDLQQGIDAYTRIGFTVSPGGVHPGKGTHNAIAFHEEDYLELLSVDRAEQAKRVPRRAASTGGPPRVPRAGRGLPLRIVQSDDLPADVHAMRRRGVDVSDAVEGGRRTPADASSGGARRGSRAAEPAADLLPRAPDADGGARPPEARAGHPNGVLGHGPRVHRGRGRGAAAQTYGRVLGMPAPRCSAARHQSGHGGVQSRADGPDGGAARRARPGRRRARPSRPRAVPGAVPHAQHGRRGALDGGPWRAAAGARHPQHRRAGDARATGPCVRRLHRLRRGAQ